MGYTGETYQIQCNQGGLNLSRNHDVLAPTAMVEGSKNLVFYRGGRKKRGGTSIYRTFLSGAPTVLNIIQFEPHGFVTWSSDGVIRHNGITAPLPQPMTAGSYCDFAIFDNELYFVNSSDPPMLISKTGIWVLLSSYVTLTVDWSATRGYPSWVVVHGRGNSRRLWMGGVTNDPEKVYGSKDGDGHNFSDEENCVYILDIETGHEKGIVGAIAFGGKLTLFSRKNAFFLDDSSADTTMWGYNKAPWNIGVVSQRTIVRTPNDIICLNEDGHIYSIVAVQESNDYKSASLSSSAYIDEYIRETFDLTEAEKFHADYDPVKRKIRFFFVLKGSTQVSNCLVYYIDRGPEEAWMLEDSSVISGYNAASSAVVRIGGTTFYITGSYNGKVWRLDTVNANDNGSAFYSGFKTPILLLSGTDFERMEKQFKRFWLGFQVIGNFNVSIKITVDGVTLPTKTISLSSGSTAAVYGIAVYGTAVYTAFEMSDGAVNIDRIGKRIQIEVYNSTVNEDMFISQMQIDYKPLGKRAE